MLNAGADVHLPLNGISPLQRAVQADDVSSARMLLQAGADPDVYVQDTLSLLAVTAATGDAGVVEVMLQHGATSSSVAGMGHDALQIACGRGMHSGDFTIAQLLLDSPSGAPQVQAAQEVLALCLGLAVDSPPTASFSARLAQFIYHGGPRASVVRSCSNVLLHVPAWL